jgi:divalent metal cation (Fe/Co/Zn/Cd) transporter
VRVQEQASPAEVVGVGLVFAGAGVYFILSGVGLLPMPGPTTSPPFVIVFAGAAFLFAGFVAVIRARVGAGGQESELPSDAPRWAQVSYRAGAIACAGSLAVIGTWIAIGSGPRAFTISESLVEMQTTGQAIGRTVFALGAVIVWIYVIALTISTVRKFFRRDTSASPSR